MSMLSFSARQSLLARCLQHPNGFYRRLYGSGDLAVSTEAEWQRLRPVTKDDLLTVPLADRSFLPLSELDHVRASSGTSGKPPLFSPRTHVRGLDCRLQYHRFERPFLAYAIPMTPHWHERFHEEHGYPPRVISIDPQFPEATVRLATVAGVDAVSLFAYQLRTIGEAMKATGLNERIVFVEIAGEACSRARYEYARATFPRATLVHSYGSSEVEDVPMGMPCGVMRETEPFAVYHPKESHFLEIVDSETLAPVPYTPGAEGELLITSYPGEPAAFPLIRFRIGDTARIVEMPCEHGGEFSFTIVGRTDIDFIKLEGGVIRVDEVERVMRSLSDIVTDEFELHRFEHATPEGPRTRLELRVELRMATDLDALARAISERLRINPEKSYADGVAAGRFLPLVCVPLVKGDPNQKHKRIISHL
jgi:phenylacetate-coenzyme A ligase PaaK-like adenylate-forming protein